VRRRVLRWLVLPCAVALFADPAAAADLPTGRTVQPAGAITPLHVFPTGAAVSPDGSTVVAIAGAASHDASGVEQAPLVSLQAIDAATGIVRQSIPVGDAFQSVVWSADGQRVYVAGGKEGVVHVLAVGPLGLLTRADDLPTGGFTSGLALDPQGRALWAALPDDGRVVRLDLAGGPLRSVNAPSPDQLVLSPGAGTLYASAWRGSSVSAVDVTSGALRSIPVGEHPTALAVLGDGTLLVTGSGDATLTTVAPDGARAVTRLDQIGRGSDSPNALAVGRDGRVFVGLGADDAVAVLAPRRGGPSPWRLAGLIPTGWYPTALALSPDGATLHVVTGKGLGRSALATAPFLPLDPASFGVNGAHLTVGTLERVAVPDDEQLRRHTATVRAALAPPAAPRSPVFRGRRGPIRHVIYITRENKTYDALLGDLHPGPGTALTLFGESVTPNLHALQREFVEPQNFTFPGSPSVVGHMWEDAGTTTDVYERVVAAQTNDSWSEPTNYPRTGLLTEQAWRAGRTVRTYNEELAQQSKRLPERLQAPQSVFPDYDLKKPDVGRVAGWLTEFRQFESRRCTGVLAATYGRDCDLPALEYVYLGEDHTTVVNQPGYPTIQAQVADNDLATAQVIDAVSHSRYWRSTVVIVVEDDPQGTGDSRSAYRGPLVVASPWAKRGYITDAPYNLTSVVGALDLMLGLEPLTDYARTSRPLDDLFTSKPDTTPFTADPSAVRDRYPFTPLPGVPPRSDAANGVFSFTEPDATDPAIAGAATWRQVKGSDPPLSR
jgi:sugar lactone lactonase YvrE